MPDAETHHTPDAETHRIDNDERLIVQSPHAFLSVVVLYLLNHLGRCLKCVYWLCGHRVVYAATYATRRHVRQRTDDDHGTDDGTDGRTEDGDGDDGTDTTGRTKRGRTTTTDERTDYYVPPDECYTT